MRSDRMLYIVLAVIVAAVVLLVVNDDAGRTFGLDNGEFGGLIWGGLLMTVIGAGILARGGFGGAGLKYAAIWLALIVALVIGYRLYQGEPAFPSGAPEPPAPASSGTGISASLMDGVDGRLHLVGPWRLG